MENPEGLSPEEIQARIDEQLAKVRVHDLLLESVVGILNLAARRIAKEDERDLEQGRLGIEAVRAVVGLLEPEPANAVRDALSELQMLYAREAGAGDAPPPVEPAGEAGGQEPPGQAPPSPSQEPPSRLWTPGSTS